MERVTIEQRIDGKATRSECLRWAEDALREALAWEVDNAPAGQRTVSPRITIDAIEAALAFVCSARNRK